MGAARKYRFGCREEQSRAAAPFDPRDPGNARIDTVLEHTDGGSIVPGTAQWRVPFRNSSSHRIFIMKSRMQCRPMYCSSAESSGTS